jgi:hypothetical protein
VVAIVLAIGLGAAAPAVAPQRPALGADQLFQTSRIWTVHLTLTNDAFTALTPMLPPPSPPTPAQLQAMAEAQAQMQAQMQAQARGQSVPRPAVPSVLPPNMLRQVVGGQFLAQEGARNGISGTKGLDFEYVHASLDIDEFHFDDVAVRPKGNGTYNPVLTGKVQKPSLKIDLNKYVKGQKLAGVATLNLHNSLFDPTWMNEALALRLYRDAGVPAPRTAFARVYVTAKGGAEKRYLGLYTLVENVDDDFTESRFRVAGGALFKPVTIRPFKYLSNDWSDYNQMYDPKTDLTAAHTQRVIDFSDLLTNASDQVFTARIGEFLDLDAFAKYMAVVVWMANPDSLLRAGQNFYVHLNPATNKFVFLPWDQDHSFGQFIPWATAESQQQLDIMQPWTDQFAGAPFAAQMKYDLLARTFGLDSFKRKYLAELATLTRTLTVPDRIARQIDDLVPVIGPLVPQEPKDGRVISFDAAVKTGTFKRPFNPNSPDVNAIKVFVPLRQASVLAQLKAQGVQ